MGIKEHIVFPEIEYDKVDQIWGMDIVVCTNASNDDEARALLHAFNFPFRHFKLLASEKKIDKMNSLYQPVLFEHEQNSLVTL